MCNYINVVYVEKGEKIMREYQICTRCVMDTTDSDIEWV